MFHIGEPNGEGPEEGLPVLTGARTAAVDIAALERVEGWVRARFGLPDAALVLVREEAPAVPGALGPATTVLFWDAGGGRYRLRLFKPVAEVDEADLPARWLLGALKDEGDEECC